MTLIRRPASTDLPLRIGLTGSIGMGKSTAANHMRKNNIPVLDSDAIVHELYAGEAVGPIAKLFPNEPDLVIDGAINRQKLGQLVLDNDVAMKRLEALIHPLVRARHQAFFETARRDGAKMACVDIPLLFETGAQDQFDVVLVVSASFENQKKRVLTRPNMTEEKFASIHARQMLDVKKRLLADFVINTDRSKEETFAALDAVFATLNDRVREREILQAQKGLNHA